MKRIYWLLCLASWLAGSPCQAERINWNSLDGLTNLSSAEEPMDGGFNFELGVFIGSFVPTLANTAQWAANWVPAQRVAYNGTFQQFTGEFTVEDNTAPFVVGKFAYIWGFKVGTAGSEWILFRNSTWTWPAPNLMNPTPPHWDAADATAIIGTILANGSPFLMKSAAVTATSPTTSWGQWSLTELAGVASGVHDDPDHDGVSNLLEFVFGTAPKVASVMPPAPMELVTVSSQQFLQISLPRRLDHSAKLTVQVSHDLLNWDSGAGVTASVSDTPEAWVVRDLTPFSPSAPRRFMRLKAELPDP